MKQAEKIYPLTIFDTENSGSVHVMFEARRFVLNAERYSEILAGVLICSCLYMYRGSLHNVCASAEGGL